MIRRLILASLAFWAASAAAQELDIQRWQAAGGAEVLFVERTELPIVDVRVVFDAGSARDGDHPGLARLVSNLLLEGTDALSSGEIARRFERYGARVSTDSGRDTANVSLRALSGAERLDPVIERAETANGTFYRVQVGEFASLGNAEALCDRLKQRNASCFVIRR